MPRYRNQIFVHSVADAMLVATGVHSASLTESITLSDTFLRTSLRSFIESISLTDSFITVKLSLRVYIETISISPLFIFKKNGSNVAWTHIQKSASSTWTKVSKSVSTWTHTNKSNQ